MDKKKIVSKNRKHYNATGCLNTKKRKNVLNGCKDNFKDAFKVKHNISFLTIYI
jgi:hypothetical protein